MREEVVGGGHRNDILDFFPPAWVHAQIAKVNRPKIHDRMVFGSSPLCCEVFDTFFPFAHFDLTETRAILIETSSLLKRVLVLRERNLCYLFRFQSLSGVKWWGNSRFFFFQEKPEILNKHRPLLTTCRLYVVKWASSVIDLRIWEKGIKANEVFWNYSTFCSIQFFLCEKVSFKSTEVRHCGE